MQHVEPTEGAYLAAVAGPSPSVLSLHGRATQTKICSRCGAPTRGYILAAPDHGGYLVVTRGLVNWSSNYCDFVAIAVSVAVGVSCLWSLHLKGLVRVLVTVAYAIIASVFLFFFSLTFICQVYNNCM